MFQQYKIQLKETFLNNESRILTYQTYMEHIVLKNVSTLLYTHTFDSVYEKACMIMKCFRWICFR